MKGSVIIKDLFQTIGKIRKRLAIDTLYLHNIVCHIYSHVTLYVRKVYIRGEFLHTEEPYGHMYRKERIKIFFIFER